MNKEGLKSKAVILRRRGMTYREINAHLGVAIPKATLSTWLKDVAVPEDYQLKVRKLVTKSLIAARVKARNVLIAKHEDHIRHLRVKNEHLLGLAQESKDIGKIALAMLYLGEGSKWKSHRGLVLGSSDPSLVTIYIKLLDHCYGIKSHLLRCRVSYRADQDIRVLEDYWSSITSIPRKNFYKTKPDPRTIGNKTKKLDYKGVCVVSCKGTEIQLELEQIWTLLSKGL